jgi:hypothetical protein
MNAQDRNTLNARNLMSDAERRADIQRETMQTLLTSGPYARTVARQVDDYDFNVVPEDRKPPDRVAPGEDIPNPINPYCGEKV